MQKWIIIGVVILIIILTSFIFINTKVETEIIPEEEISNVDLRKTMITLYYRNKTTKEILAETKLIDSKELLKNPYYTLINLLMNMPESVELEKTIPENVTLKDVYIDKNTVTVIFSKEILAEGNIDPNIVECVTKTLLQLNEVEKVIIQAEGNENNTNNVT